jgi:predicted RNase H-like HicB family nuclease
MRYAIVIEKADANYSAYVPDLPGCVATGNTIKAVQLKMRDAIRFHIAGLKEEGCRCHSRPALLKISTPEGCERFLRPHGDEHRNVRAAMRLEPWGWRRRPPHPSRRAPRTSIVLANYFVMRALSDCVACQACCHAFLSLRIALRMVRSLRATARSATIFGLFRASRP